MNSAKFLHRGGARHGLGGHPKMSLSPPQRETYWSRIGRWQNCVEIFKFWLFLQSKSRNNVCKLFQLLEMKSPRHPTGGSLLDPTGRLLSPNPSGYSPKMKFPGVSTVFAFRRQRTYSSKTWSKNTRMPSACYCCLLMKPTWPTEQA